MIDHLWPDFMPDLGTFPTDCDFKRTAFASTAGKLFLYYSDWPFNIDHKEVTFNLFHHHGGAFLNLYSEVPQQLTVSHSLQYINGSPTFEVTADEGSFIGISAGGEVVATALGTGSVVSIDIPQQLPYTTMKVTVTKQNYYRYSEDIAVITQGPYLIFDEVAYTEIAGHIDDSLQPLDIIEMDITIRNIGLTSSGDDVTAVLSSTSNQVNIIDDQLSCGVIAATGILTVEDAFQVEFLAGIEDETDISFELEVTSSGVTWTSEFDLELLASELRYDLYSVEMTSGVENILDPGETGEIMVSIQNIGSGFSYDTNILLNTNDPYVTLTGSGFIPVIDPGETEISVQPISVSISPDCPVEYFALIELTACDENGLIHENSFNLPIGFIANCFEIGDIGWEHIALGNDWLDEWHLSSYRNFTTGGQYSMKCGGLDENHYSNFVYAALIMPEIVLGNNSTVTFHHWMNVSANNNGLTGDGGLIEISLNGGNWEQITPVGGYPYSMVNMQTSPFAAGTAVFAGEINWEEVELDLSYYSGTAQIRFVLGSCGLVTNEGWYIDDVIYTNTTGADNNSVFPLVTSLKSNFPNPFNPTTTISFSTTESTENTKISIYNLKGQKVKTLINEKLPDGQHSVVWKGTDNSGKSVSSGIYFYKMKSGNFEQTKKMILMK